MSKAISPADEIRNSLTRMEPQFKMALPSHISVEKFTRVAQTAIAMNPNLLKADRNSLFAACMFLAQQGMMADSREASLVCFGDKVTPMIMISGVLKRLRNSGELSTILAELVYEKDVFNYWIDSGGQHLEHRPLMFGDRGKQIGVYALAKTKSDDTYIEVMSMADIEAVKKSSRSAGSGPWVTFPSEMMKKVVIRRLAKRLPMSTDISMDDPVLDLREAAMATAPVPHEPSIQDPPADVTPRKKKSNLEKIVEASEPEVVVSAEDIPL